jgi:predicted AAA+ superfamily ATPase
LNYDGYDVIIEETKYIDENNKVLFKDDKFILILAPMGKGKTQFITKYLLFNNKKSILFISTRKSRF